MAAIIDESIETGSTESRSWASLLTRRSAVVMGILNVTPDSFSDGGKFEAPDAALAQAQCMLRDGADVLDLGAESTRPYKGARPISADEELQRLAPIWANIVALGAPVSIDTMKAEVAEWALERGATTVNDVWGLQRDPNMARVVAAYGAPVIVMHNRENADPAIDIMNDVHAFFGRSLGIAEAAGIDRTNIILDPGIGFGKTPEQSLVVLARLGELQAFGLPLLVGASRKRFINSVAPSEPHQRLGGSIAAHVLAVQNGAHFVRVHDVAETVQALRVMESIGSYR